MGRKTKRGKDYVKLEYTPTSQRVPIDLPKRKGRKLLIPASQRRKDLSDE